MTRTNHDELMIVFDAICTLAEELGTPPPQRMVADHLGVSQQYVSKVMFALESVGAIEWITRYYYRVIDATWEPPPNTIG